MRGRDKENVLHIHNEVSFSYKEEWKSCLCWKINANGDDHFEAVRSVSERQVFHSFMVVPRF